MRNSQRIRSGMRGNGVPNTRPARKFLAALECLEKRWVPATIVVTGTGDTIAADEIVTLREAITAANTNMPAGDAPAGDPGLDTITFNIPAADPRHFYYVDDGAPGVTRFTSGGALALGTTTEANDASIPTAGPNAIDPDWMHSWYSIEISGTPLPAISEPVIINGFSQPGATANTNPIAQPINSILRIEVFQRIGDEFDGFTLQAGESTIQGLSIQGFGFFDDHNGVVINSDDNLIAGNHIGVDVSGLTGYGNHDSGVLIDNGSNNRIGGTDPAARTLIGANRRYGVWISGAEATMNRVQGARIFSHPNWGGILLENGTTQNLIGGTDPGAANVIGGNQQVGIRINSPGTSQNRIEGNFIGTDPNGSDQFVNNTGIELSNAGSGNVIGGLTDTPGTAPGNVIAGGLYGIFIYETSGTQILGNLIGTTPSGTVALPNFYSGVIILGGSNTIGGEDPRARNVISGSRTRAQIDLQGDGSTVQNNFIGTDLTGLAPLQDPMGGPFLDGGGGIQIIGSNHLIRNNIIAFNNLFIGDEEGGAPYGGGVRVAYGLSNRIAFNSIHSNAGLGIELQNGDFPDGIPLPNDPVDADDGPNLLTNKPVLLSATASLSDTTVNGTFNGLPFTTYILQFFANRAVDPSGFGEGESYLGDLEFATDDTGNAAFSVTLPTLPELMPYITATATDPEQNTSEFSGAVTPSDGNDTQPPTIVNLARYGFHAQPTLLVLTFSEPVRPETAGNRSSYTVLAPGRDRQLGTEDDAPIDVSSAYYDQEALTVTLRLTRRLNLHRLYQLRVDGSTEDGIRDLAGNLLDGDASGSQSGDAQITVDRSLLAGPAYEAPNALELGIKPPRKPAKRVAMRLIS